MAVSVYLDHRVVWAAILLFQGRIKLFLPSVLDLEGLQHGSRKLMIAHDLELVVVTGIFKSFVFFIAVLRGFVVLIGTTAILTSFISLLQFHSLLFSFASRLLNRLRHDFQQVFIDYRRSLFCRASRIFIRQQRAGLLLCIVAVSAEC